MKPRLALAAGAALILVLAGCNRPDPAAQAAAETAGFEAFVKAAARKSPAELTPDELKEAIDQYIGMEVATATAVKSGLDKEPAIQGQLDLTRMNTLTEAVLSRYLEANPVTDEEIQKEYDEQVANAPMEYKAGHILVDDKALAEAIIKKLEAGGDFAALAKEYSKDSSAANGGDLGWFTPQTMVKPFADAVTGLEKGKFTATPVETQFGWHVVRLEDTRKPSLPPLDQVREQVKQLVQRKRIRAHLVELRKDSGVNVDETTARLTAYAESGVGSGKADAGKAAGDKAPATP